MRQLLASLLLACNLFAADIYVSPTVTGGGSGARNDPNSFAGRCGDTFTPGDRLILMGGAYRGRFTCTGAHYKMTPDPLTCSGGRLANPAGSCPQFEAYLTYTLAADLANASGTSTVSVSLGNGLTVPSSFTGYVDTEELNCINRTGTGPTYSFTCNRGWSGSTIGAHTATTTIYADGFLLSLQGSDITVENIEFMSSFPGRGSTSTALEQIKAMLTIGIDMRCADCNAYGNVIHDLGDGIDTWVATTNGTVQDNVIYNSGYDASDRGHGKALYQENSTGFRHVYDNVGVNAWDKGSQFFGVTGSFNGGVIQGNIIANSGVISAYGPQWNMLVGTQSVAIPDVTIGSNRFYGGSESLHIGFNGLANTHVAATNNYVSDGMTIDNWSAADGSGNVVYDTAWPTISFANGPAAGTYNWDHNSYYDQTAIHNCSPGSKRAMFAFNGFTGPCAGSLDFTEWKADSSYDASSTYAVSRPPDAVLIRPSSLTSGRCTVAIYNWSHAATVAVDLSQCGSSAGQGYRIVNAFNPLGAAVATGTYNSGAPNVTVTMSDAAVTAVAVPPGATPAPTTAPEFLALIVVPTTSTYGFAGSLRGSAK